MRAVLLTGNLMCRSRVTGVLRGHGIEVEAVRTPDDLEQALEVEAAVVILDLSEGAWSGDVLAERIRNAGATAPILAFGPHVNHAALEAAAAGGCTVLTRGQFDAELPRLARQWAGG